MTAALLEAVGLTKSYGGIQALKGVDLVLQPGQVHALLGENGAGKSTLVGVCSGAVQPDGGRLLMDGEDAAFSGPHRAGQAGIAVVHQEPALAPSLTVLANLLLPDLGRARWSRTWRPERRREQVEQSLRDAGLELDLDARVEDLAVSSRQLVEIAKAVSLKPRVLFLDEPNSALSPAETTRLFDAARRMCATGAAVVLISHRISEVFSIADHATVMRDGSTVWSGAISDTSPAEVIAMISHGHRSVAPAQRVEAVRPTAPAAAAVRTPGVAQGPQGGSVRGSRSDAPLLECVGLTRAGEFEDVCLDVRPGEVVGVSGLVGAGRTELARCLFGLTPPERGQILVEGRPVTWKGPRDAIRAGLALVPEDRAVQSMFRGMSVRWNLTAAATAIGRAGTGSAPTADELAQQLGIKARSLDVPVSSLSGGNQQKAVLGRWLMTRPKVLILDEPTRGIDVGAKAQIYDVVRRLAADGLGVVLISSEVEEIGELATRVAVMRRGQLVAHVPSPTDVRSIMAAAFGEAA